MMKMLRDPGSVLGRNEAGQAVVEYAMVVGFVCLMVVGILASDAPGWLSGVTANISAAVAGIA